MSDFNIKIDEDNFELNISDLNDLNLSRTGNGTYHFLHENQAYHIKVISANFNDKSITLSINGNQYPIKIQDKFDQLVNKMGLSAGNSQKIKSIKAPMPGLILDILVEPGQEINKGSQLAILEAMKMENILKAEGEGIVKSIEVNKGAAVDKGQVLIEME